MIGIGIIGAGSFGEKHAEALASQPNARLIASNRTNVAALDEFTKRYGGRGYQDYRDLLDDREVEAVVIATPHHLHADIAVQAASAGKHILLEKPLAENLEECNRIFNSVRTNPIVFMAGMINHFVPAYSTAHQLLSSGKMGKLVMILDKTMKPWWSPNRRKWHLNRSTGGGMWMTVGVHGVDRLNWLSDSRACTVSASMGTHFHEQAADDGGGAFIRYENGVVGTVIFAGYREGAPVFETEIVCTQGLLKVDKSLGVFIGKNNSWTHLPGSDSVNWMDDALVKEWQAFLSAIENRSEPPISLEFSRHVMEVVFAAEESALQNREIVL